MQERALILSGVRLHAEESEEFQFPNTLALYEYWKRKRGDRPRPRWGEFNLMEIYDVAPCICVRDVVPGSDDFVCRYWGTRMTELYGVDCTGKKIFDTYPDGSARRTLGIYRRALASAGPLRLVGNLGYVDKSELKFFEAVFLRLDGNDRADQHIIGAFEFDCELCEADMAKLGPFVDF